MARPCVPLCAKRLVMNQPAYLVPSYDLLVVCVSVLIATLASYEPPIHQRIATDPSGARTRLEIGRAHV